MISRIDLQPAYVLHSQPFQNTSLLVDFLCLDYGRIRAVARGARRAGSRNKSQLQPFQPLLVSLGGRGEVKTLAGVESSTGAIGLTGMGLFSGLYMNELLTRLLQFHEPCTPLYQCYQHSLLQLSGSSELAPVLRRFELSLLRELGYAIDLESEGDTGLPIDADSLYQFLPELGFQRLAGDSSGSMGAATVFSGRDLLTLHASDFNSRAAASAAKRLLRLALQVHLGSKPLASRQLFLSMSLSAERDTG